MSKYSDIEIVEGLKRGSDAHLKWVYTEYYTMVESLILSNSGDKENAKDIYQESMVVLYENCQKEGFELNCKLSSYLYSIARNLWLKQLRKKSNNNLQIEKDFSDFENVETEIVAYEEEKERFAMLDKAFQKLGEACTRLIKLFYYEGLKMDQIAEQLGYTNSANAKNQKYKCFKRFKAILTDMI